MSMDGTRLGLEMIRWEKAEPAVSVISDEDNAWYWVPIHRKMHEDAWKCMGIRLTASSNFLIGSRLQG